MSPFQMGDVSESLEDGASKDDVAALLLESIDRIRSLKAQLKEKGGTGRVAIVGAACRFPGAETLDELWDILCAGRTSIRYPPEGRWNGSGAEQGTNRDLLAGGFLDNLEFFDSAFFGIAPADAGRMDPRQRILLESVWSALEDAGVPPSTLQGSKTGVYIGLAGQAGPSLSQAKIGGAVDLASALGSGAAGRVAYTFGLRGPTLTVDTACSSSLVALHLATQGLILGECDLAIVAGINLLQSAAETIAAAEAGLISSTGACHPFGADADGFVRGEGCGVVVLRRESDVGRSGSRRATVRGSALNHNGRAAGLTAPSGIAQEQVIRAALERAGANPAEVTFVEAHGTGTPLGDALEAQALSRTYGAARREALPLAASKAFFGHLELASGMLSLLKAILVLRRGLLPANGTYAVRSDLSWRDLHLLPVTEPIHLSASAGGATHLAAISAFGGTGTNAHVLIEGESQCDSANDNGIWPFFLSGKTQSALRNALRRLSRWLKERPEGEISLRDLAYTLHSGRDHFAHRAAVVAGSTAQCAQLLASLAEGASADDATQWVMAEAASAEQSESLGRETRLMGLARQYCEGKMPKWSGMIDEDQKDNARLISIPTYPFERTSCSPMSGRCIMLHPLTHRAGLRDGQSTYHSTFDGSETFFSEHRVLGHSILPGVAYIEMLRAAVTSGQFQPVRISNLVWLRPTVPGDLTLTFSPLEGAKVFATAGDAAGDTIFAQAVVQQASIHEPVATDLRAIFGRCGREVSVEDVYAGFSGSGVSYGPSFRTLTALRGGIDEALGLLERRSGPRGEELLFDPGVLDGALQAAAGIEGANGRDWQSLSEGRLPFALSEAQLLSPLPDRCWSWVRRVSGSDTLDVDVLDEEGRPCVRLRGLAFRLMQRKVAQETDK
ncbi:polyketide synthase dehydratase domain-containing protein, partial [Sphingobium yanoikuyae]